MQVQTFLCLPLGDKGGLVEWVMNTQPFISIVRETGKRLRRDAMKLMSTADRQKWQPLWERYRSCGSNRAELLKAHHALLDFFKKKLRAIEPVMHVWWLTRCRLPESPQCHPCRLLRCVLLTTDHTLGMHVVSVVSRFHTAAASTVAAAAQV